VIRLQQDQVFRLCVFANPSCAGHHHAVRTE
jgi:hypothetical protein